MWFRKQTLKQVRNLMRIHLFYLAGGEKEKCYIKKLSESKMQIVTILSNWSLRHIVITPWDSYRCKQPRYLEST